MNACTKHTGEGKRSGVISKGGKRKSDKAVRGTKRLRRKSVRGRGKECFKENREWDLCMDVVLEVACYKRRSGM